MGNQTGKWKLIAIGLALAVALVVGSLATSGPSPEQISAAAPAMPSDMVDTSSTETEGMSIEDAAALAEVRAGGGKPLTDEQIMTGR